MSGLAGEGGVLHTPWNSLGTEGSRATLLSTRERLSPAPSSWLLSPLSRRRSELDDLPQEALACDRVYPGAEVRPTRQLVWLVGTGSVLEGWGKPGPPEVRLGAEARSQALGSFPPLFVPPLGLPF